MIAPLSPGSGVEEHADDREVDPRPRALVRRAVRQGAIELPRAVATTHVEVPPATVQRHAKIGIAGPGGRGHELGRDVNASEIDVEVSEPVVEPSGQHRAGALANRPGSSQIGDRGVGRRVGAHGSPRPLRRASSAASGTSPFVK